MQSSGPIARFDNLVTTTSAHDLLVYDTVRHHIHHLNPLAAAVWRLCDGRRSVVDIAGEATRELGGRIDPDAVRVALAQLADADLLAETIDPAMRVSGRTRRSFLRRAALAGVVAPVIASVSAPQAAAQTSCEAGYVPCGIVPCCEEDNCRNGMCCPTDVCEDGQCCIGGECVGGTCCPAPQVCGDRCCTHGTCSNTGCCLGNVCPDGSCCIMGSCDTGTCIEFTSPGGD